MGACAASSPKPETDSCRSCPHRERCHGHRPELNQDTLMRLVREATLEVLGEYEARARPQSAKA